VEPRQVWRAANLLTKLWDGELVVFNLDSGNTHLLTPVAGQTLKVLIQGPADVQELSRRLAAQVELESDPELHRSIAVVIQQFEALGLIHPAGE
jgi:PqqD family protein of HPr-rel-A system